MNFNQNNYFLKSNVVTEVTFISLKNYKYPFNDIELDFMFLEPDGKETIVPESPIKKK